MRHHHSRGLGLTSSAVRHRMVDELRSLGIVDERVLATIGRIARHEFVEEALSSEAYRNRSLPIGHAQTISQPYIVALMTQAALAGADCATIPPDVFEALFKHPLTEKGLQQFMADWATTGQSIL